MKALLRLAILTLLVASGYAAMTTQGTQVGTTGPTPRPGPCGPVTPGVK